MTYDNTAHTTKTVTPRDVARTWRFRRRTIGSVYYVQFIITPELINKMSLDFLIFQI